jgi:hypothetical protein
MTELERQRDSDGTTTGEFRVRHVAGRPRDRWGVGIGERRARRQSRSVTTTSSCAELRGARHAIRHAEKEQLLRDRVIGHTVVGCVATAVFVVVLPLVESLGTFAVVMIALFVALKSFTSAVSVRLGDAWGWNRGTGAPPPLTWPDRAVLAGAEWFRRRSRAAATPPPPGAIRVLPPGSPE